MYKNNNKLLYYFTLLLVAGAGVIFLLLIDRDYRNEVMQESDRRLDEAASRIQRRLSVALYNLSFVSVDLNAFLLSQPDPPNRQAFADFSATLQHYYPVIDALVYVGPDRIIRDIYPLKGNERAIGLDLSKRPVAPYIDMAIRERELIVDPPHTMTNGRLAVIARSPLFRGKKFVGLAQTILNVPDVVQKELGGLDKEFAIQILDTNGKKFWGVESLSGATQRRDVVVGNGSWTLLVAQVTPPKAKASVLALIWGLGGLVVMLTLWGVRRDYHLRLSLEAKVEAATRNLRLRNEGLEKQIEKRLQAEASVRRSEKNLREAQQIAHVGNWVRDIADGRLYWSDELYRIFGFEPQEFEPTFESFLSRVHPDDLGTIRQGLTAAQESNTPFEFEFRILLSDGRTRYLRASGVVECDVEGNLQRTAGTVQDITVQKLALKALEESERKYRAVLEYASDGIIIASTEGVVLDVNRRIQTLLGYSRDELRGMHVSEIHPPEIAEKHRIAFANIRERGAVVTERLVLRKDGTPLPVEIAGTLITFDSQQLILGIFRDISERKRNEAELRQYRDHLEQLVEQRTAELAALNEELEAFSYSVSHDLQAPLRAIKGFSTALLEDCGQELDTTCRAYLERINSASGRMGCLIDDLLHLSYTAKTDMQCETISLSAVVLDLLQELRAADPERQVHAVVADGVVANCDPSLIRSLLQNLLSNAWKFTRTRDQAVIEFGVATGENKPVYFVRDNGIGFRMNHTRDLFKPFYRLHGPADYEGSGIGLATVQRIVHRHGGQVWAESEPERSATFYFTLGQK